MAIYCEIVILSRPAEKLGIPENGFPRICGTEAEEEAVFSSVPSSLPILPKILFKDSYFKSLRSY